MTSCASVQTMRKREARAVANEGTKPPQMVLVSACLLGVKCRYDGACKPNDHVLSHKGRFVYIPFCPECYGGLPTPRAAAEIQPDGRVVNNLGTDVTEAYQKGAAQAVTLCRDFKINYAILKSRSPACGPDSSYDGTFTRTLVARPGLCAQALMDHGVTVFSEESFDPSLLEA